MSNFSEKREEAAKQTTGPSWRWLIAGAAVLVVCWIGYDVYSSRQVSTLDGFAKCLNASGARMYGAWWCPHCAEQKEQFGYAFQYVNYVECGVEGQAHSENDGCKQSGIKNFPTWEFKDGSRKEGVLKLPELSDRTGCKLP
jgi:hypothetical protein